MSTSVIAIIVAAIVAFAIRQIGKSSNDDDDTMATNSVEEENRERVQRLLLADGFQVRPWGRTLAASHWGHNFVFDFTADAVNIIYPGLALCKSGTPVEKLYKEAVNVINHDTVFGDAHYFEPDEDGYIRFHCQSPFLLRPANMNDECLKGIIDTHIGFLANTPRAFNNACQEIMGKKGKDATHITGFAAPTPKSEDGSGVEAEPQTAETAEETPKTTSRPIGFTTYTEKQ